MREVGEKKKMQSLTRTKKNDLNLAVEAIKNGESSNVEKIKQLTIKPESTGKQLSWADVKFSKLNDN